MHGPKVGSLTSSEASRGSVPGWIDWDAKIIHVIQGEGAIPWAFRLMASAFMGIPRISSDPFWRQILALEPTVLDQIRQGHQQQYGTSSCPH